MRLLIDAVGNKHGGGAVVLADVLNAAIDSRDIDEIVVLATPRKKRRFGFPESNKLRVVDIPRAESLLGRVYWSLFGLRAIAEKWNCAAVLTLNGIGRTHRARPTALFIQQSVPYSEEALARYPRAWQIRWSIIKYLTKHSAKAAGHVFVQSEPMRQTIARAFDLPKDGISVHMPSAPEFPGFATCTPALEGIKDASNSHGALLYVGSDAPHKNLSVIPNALRHFSASTRPMCFATLPPASEFCKNGGATALGPLDRNGLRFAYENSTALVFPSIVETVGLPMLEAMRLGCPVIAADRSFSHAVCEDAALYFDPNSPQALAGIVRRMMTDIKLREELVVRGKRLIAKRDCERPYHAMIARVVGLASFKAFSTCMQLNSK